MFLNGLFNDADSKIYKQVMDIESFFKGLETENTGGIYQAEKLSTVAAAHRILTNSIAALPVIIMQKANGERKETDHVLSNVLKVRANECMTPYMATKILISQAFWYGTGFSYIERNSRGEVTALYPLPSAGHERYIDRNTGIVWYSFSVDSGNPEEQKLKRKFTESELLIHRFESYDGYSGRGILDIAKKAISLDLMAMTYGENFYKRGARIGGIIEVDANVDEDAKTIVRRDFEAMAHGADNAFKTAVLDLGMKYKQLGISQRDSQYLETREFGAEEMSRYTGIPAYMLQGGKQSYQSNEQQQLDFVINTLTAHLVQREQDNTYKLFLPKERESGFYMKINEAGLLRGDNQSRADFYQRMLSNGIYNQDEIRAREDLPPLPDGKGQHYWMSKNFATIENMIAGVHDNEPFVEEKDDKKEKKEGDKKR